MPAKYRNLFLLIGVVAIVIMLASFDMSWADLYKNVRRAGIWFPAVVALWVPIYMMNALAWRIIIHDGEAERVSFWRILKLTISGYALNYVTPVGLLGGEPYRIMELTPFVGKAKAASSVILYAMMHIFSHFWFWLFGVVVFFVRYGHEMTWPLAVMFSLVCLFCLLAIYFFLNGYRNGLAMRTLRILSHLPFVGHHCAQMAEHHAEGLQKVDQQIAALHQQRRRTFYLSLGLEFLARLVGCLEILFILFIFTPDISFWDCVLMQAFISLFANLFFFIPMQMGTREGGLALVTDGMHMHGAYGVLTGLITRLRELIWISIGLLLIRFGNKKTEIS